MAATSMAVVTASAQGDQPYAGTVLNLSTYSAVPEYDYYATLMPDFEAKTGIKVNYVQQPVAAQDQKIPLQLTARTPRWMCSSPARRTSAPTSACRVWSRSTRSSTTPR